MIEYTTTQPKTSPVSGITTYLYNEHGELTSEADARGITVLRAVDELDRVTFVDYSNNTLDILYTYDDPSVPFSKGRLTQILRDGHAVDYEYDSKSNRSPWSMQSRSDYGSTPKICRLFITLCDDGSV